MKKLILLVAVLALFVCQAAFSLDVQPPPWRGQLSTTSQMWGFGTYSESGMEIQPDGPAPGGQPWLPSTKLWWEPGPLPFEQEWMSYYQPSVLQLHDIGYGVIPLSGWIDVIVDNHDPNPQNEKWIHIQVTWAPQSGGTVFPPIVHVDDLLNGTNEVLPIYEEPLVGPWKTTIYEIHLPQNPIDEWVYIEGDIFVDELIIDTWCIPEPGSMALIGIGLLALMKRK